MKLIKSLFYILLIIVPLHFSISTPYISDVKFLDLGVGVFTILLLYNFKKLRSQELSILKDPLDLSIYLYTFIVFIGIFLSDNPIQSLRNYFLFFSFVILFYVGRDIFSEKDLSNIEKISIWTMGISSLYAIIQFYGWYILFAPKNAGIISFFGNPNFAANFIAINTPFALSLFIKSPLSGGVIFTISYTALIMLGTRGALLAFFVGFIFFFWWTKKMGYKVLKPIILSIVIMIIITGIYSTPNPLNQRNLPIWQKLESTKEFLAKAEDKGSIKARLTFWKTALLMIEKHPIKGVGPGRFGYFYPFYQKEILKKDTSPKKHAYNAKRAHNEYIQVLSETGIPGFLVFVIMLYLLISNGIKKIKETKSLTILAFASGIGIFLIHSLFSFPFHLAPSMLYFAIFASGVIGKGKEKIQVKRVISILIYLIIIIIASFFLAYSIKSYVARIYLGKGRLELLKSVKAKDPKPLVKEGYRKVLIANYLDPYDPLSTFYLAKVYQYGGRYEKAIKYYKKFLNMYSDYNAFFNTGKCYFEMGDIENAIKTFKTLREIKPDYPELYFYLGVSYMKKRDYKNAIKTLKEGLIYIEKKEEKIPIYINLAISYKKLGDLDKAIKLLKKAEEIAPEREDIKKRLKDLEKEKSESAIPYMFHIQARKKEDIEKISALMKNIIDEVYKNFEIYVGSNFDIIIAPTSVEFEKITGIQGFYGGATIGNKIYLKPLPLIERYNPLKDLLKHEYIHILINSMGKDKPLWVQEGFAIYTSETPKKFKPKEFNFIPFYKFPKKGYDKNLYYNAYLKVSYLINQYGKSKFIEFLKEVTYYNEKEVFKKVFNTTQEDIDTNIRNQYNNG